MKNVTTNNNLNFILIAEQLEFDSQFEKILKNSNLIIINKLMRLYIYKNKYGILEFGVGKTNASSAISYILNNYQPKWIVNLGYAGSLSNKINCNDVVMVDRVRYNDVDLTKLDKKYAHGQLPNLPYEFINHTTKQISNNFDQLCKEAKILIKRGNLLTSDTFINSINQIKNNLNIREEKWIVDMEGAAISQICYNYDYKNLFIFKLISDIVIKNNNHKQYRLNINNRNTILNKFWNVILNL